VGGNLRVLPNSRNPKTNRARRTIRAVGETSAKTNKIYFLTSGPYCEVQRVDRRSPTGVTPEELPWGVHARGISILTNIGQKKFGQSIVRSKKIGPPIRCLGKRVNHYQKAAELGAARTRHRRLAMLK